MKEFVQHSLTVTLFYRISMFTICLASIAVLYIFYLLFFPSEVITLKQPVLTTSQVIRAGETLHVKVNYCKKVQAISVIVRSLVSDNGKNYVIPFAVLSSNAPIGCGTFFIDTVVPQNIPLGKYKLILSFQHQANAVQVIYGDFKTKSFLIK